MKIMYPLYLYLGLISLAIAQDISRVLPDDPLYEAKRRIESAEINAKSDPLDKAMVHLRHADARLLEIQAMAARDKPEFVNDLVNAYERELKDANADISRGQSQGRDVTHALEMVAQATQKHTEVLTGLLGKVPDKAKPAIRRSISVSRTGGNTARNRLSRITAGRDLNRNRERWDRDSERWERTTDPGYPGGMNRRGEYPGYDPMEDSGDFGYPGNSGRPETAVPGGKGKN